VRARLPLTALLVAAVTAPAVQPRPSLQVPGIEWHRAAAGLDRAIVEVAGGGEGWCTRVVAARIDPERFTFRLRARLRGVDPAWSVDRAPADAVLAVNLGQFNGITPWGWVVMNGREIRPPGYGPLSTAIAWDRSGRVRWLAQDQIEAERAAGGITEAFQSYPTLIDAAGEVPPQIREPGLGVDVDHRDTRLAIGSLADGRLVVAITRFYGLGALSPPVPLGLNLSEMAAVMRGLGCTRAVSLDGGVSAQLMMRDHGRTEVWHGWRRVPLGLVAEPLARPD
jgi:exopolysaccharide biosynthesis protein